jgi:hypothetical protein
MTSPEILCWLMESATLWLISVNELGNYVLRSGTLRTLLTVQIANTLMDFEGYFMIVLLSQTGRNN